MTQTHEHLDLQTGDEKPSTPTEQEAWQRERVLLSLMALIENFYERHTPSRLQGLERESAVTSGRSQPIE